MLLQAKAFLARGELGHIRQVQMISGQPFHRLRPGYAQSYYRDRKSGGGAIQDALTHSVNITFAKLGLHKSDDKGARKDQEEHKTKTYKAALSFLPKDQVMVSPKLK